MDICGNILNEFEIKSNELNEGIYALVLQEFLNSVGSISFKFYNQDTAGEKVRRLKDAYIYTSSYIDLFFGILAKYNYDMRNEIIDAMCYLGGLHSPNRNKAIIKKLLASPVIQDISFNGRNEFVISSEQYGDFAFELASYYFRNDRKMIDYIRYNTAFNNCHVHAYFMSKLFQDFYAITSLCSNYFVNSHYHSYTYDQTRNIIIDLNYNSIVDREMYYRLFSPEDISIILNSQVEHELALTEAKTDQYHRRCNLLKIALYKQYLRSIGYQGSLDDAPLIKHL